MYSKSPKKLIIMNILDILKRYTDENHRLSQKEIQDILEREYDMKVERKAIKRNLMNLIEFGYNINFSESIRILRDKFGEEQENVILSDFYLEREFTDSELRLLIDSVLFSNHIPYKQDKTTVARLLTSILYEEKVIDRNRFVECGRQDLVGRYVGWTAKQVEEQFRKAMGGILFIDEAYSLVEREGLYGDEAIKILR